ncbi:MAG: prepilin-type N-terminal cleavage/methylation domain-containing protein, partial [Pirellulaceae bacterium]|nr:prepilin-type N-terminal cleavage/methylation domain-containing protein [Pirellulaceae bacterium]
MRTPWGRVLSIPSGRPALDVRPYRQPLVHVRENSLFQTKRPPNAFTLLELLLAIAIVAALSAVAIPQIGMMLGDRRLVRAADQLRIEITERRVEAMREGRV